MRDQSKKGEMEREGKTIIQQLSYSVAMHPYILGIVPVVGLQKKKKIEYLNNLLTPGIKLAQMTNISPSFISEIT